MKNLTLLLVLTFAGLLAGCNETTQAAHPPAPPKPDDFQTGRFALQKLIPAARNWQPDAQPNRVESSFLNKSDGKNGKSGSWVATFVSGTALKTITYSWSGMSEPDAPKRGIDHTSQDSYNPENHSTQPFDLNYLRTDTDNAFQVAQEHGGKKLMEKDPKVLVKYLLDWDVMESQLRWHVIYAGSLPTSKLAVVVDATTGRYLRIE